MVLSLQVSIHPRGGSARRITSIQSRVVARATTCSPVHLQLQARCLDLRIHISHATYKTSPRPKLLHAKTTDQDMLGHKPSGSDRASEKAPKLSRHQRHIIREARTEARLSKKKDRASQRKVLKDLTRALERSNLGGENKTSPTRRQHTIVNNNNSRRVGKISFGSHDGKTANKNVQSRKKSQRLGFEAEYVGKLLKFMSEIELQTWIESVFKPHLDEWCRECLSAPASQLDVDTAHDDPLGFANAVLSEAMDHQESSGLLGPVLWAPDACFTPIQSKWKQRDGLTFIQHSATTACLVVRDGLRAGKFAEISDEQFLHTAAALLLTTVLINLRTGSPYFQKLSKELSLGTNVKSSWESENGQVRVNEVPAVNKMNLCVRVKETMADGGR